MQAGNLISGDIVAIRPDDSPLADVVRTLGWQVDTSGDPAILLADARADADGLNALAETALAMRAALVAIVSDPAGADRAEAAGATHALIGEPDDAILDRTLRFAARHARRLRGAGRSRRAGEDDGSAIVQRALATAPVAAAVVFARFEIVNAAYGRATGNRLLGVAERRIIASAGEGAAIVRGDGAYFLAALGDETAVARIERALAQPIVLDGRAIHLGPRIGVARRGVDEPAEEALSRARDALAEWPGGESATVRIAAPAGGVPIPQLAADLHHAIDRGDIAVLFQPQVTLDTDAVVGVEVLARWNHPVLGPLGADALFAAAGRADLGIALSDHIHGLALTHAARWPEPLSRLRLALNVTAADLARADFPQRFAAMLARSGIPPTRVTVEITETGLLADLDAASAILMEVRAGGCRIAIDDFGTGYSSLAYLAALPLDYIKIDRRLTQAIVAGERARIVVRSVIAMARALKIETIAEGVETEEQRALLAADGCTLYQGFLRSAPLDDAALIALVRR